MRWPWTKRRERKRARRAAEIHQAFRDLAAVSAWNREHPDRQINIWH